MDLKDGTEETETGFLIGKKEGLSHKEVLVNEREGGLDSFSEHERLYYAFFGNALNEYEFYESRSIVKRVQYVFRMQDRVGELSLLKQSLSVCFQT